MGDFQKENSVQVVQLKGAAGLLLHLISLNIFTVILLISHLTPSRVKYSYHSMDWRVFIPVTIAVVSIATLWMLTWDLPVPELDLDTYWGPGDESKYLEDETIRSFKIVYEQEIMNDLIRVLERPLNLQEPLEDVGFQYGFNSRTMRPLVDYWRIVYLPKWKAQQEYLNKFKQYMTQINGLHIHFVHETPHEIAPGREYIRIPILLLHGWPGSVREFYDLIPKLTTYPDDHVFVFDVVAPSLVGFGFSSAAAKKGFCTYEMAIVMRKLMLRLGYDKFIVQGGDWGSVIGSQLVTLFPENAIAYHANLCLLSSPLSLAKAFIANLCPTLFVEKEHVGFHFPVMDKIYMLIEESGYFHQQATKPDTLGIALATSPVGLAAWILEKFSTGTGFDNRLLEDGGLDNSTIHIDAMLDNIMIYYLTNSITSSMRFYAESMSQKQLSIPFDRIPSKVPMGCVRFKNDLPSAFDWQLRSKFPNMLHSTYVNHGGHFPAMQNPDDLYSDMIGFFKKVYAEKQTDLFLLYF